jgi:hypothetical protein
MSKLNLGHICAESYKHLSSRLQHLSCISDPNTRLITEKKNWWKSYKNLYFKSVRVPIENIYSRVS